MTEQYFKTRPWPAVDDVQDLVGNDQVSEFVFAAIQVKTMFSKPQYCTVIYLTLNFLP